MVSGWRTTSVYFLHEKSPLVTGMGMKIAEVIVVTRFARCM